MNYNYSALVAGRLIPVKSTPDQVVALVTNGL